MSTKQFRIEAVAGVATGLCLEAGGMSGIQDAMDHFYPGIMTIGCAAMQPAASQEIKRQLPEFYAVCVTCDASDIDGFVADLRARFGDTVPLDGPLATPPDDEIDAAFRKVAAR